MRIPGMPVWGARAIMDAGFYEVYELQGRSPESLYEDLRNKQPTTPEDRLSIFRLAVYYADNSEPDPKLLNPEVWR